MYLPVHTAYKLLHLYMMYLDYLITSENWCDLGSEDLTNYKVDESFFVARSLLKLNNKPLINEQS